MSFCFLRYESITYFKKFRDEYEFIPVLEPERNVSPLVLERHKLGFEIWGVQILYMYSYSTLMKWRSAKRAEFFLGTLLFLSEFIHLSILFYIRILMLMTFLM